jgi:hypothetical protein
MHTISYSDYFDRLNHELNTWNGILAIIEHTLKKCGDDNITSEVTTLDMVHDIAEIHKQSLLEEMQDIASCLAEDGIETGLVVSPIVRED